jgi:hypothetical protein
LLVPYDVRDGDNEELNFIINAALEKLANTARNALEAITQGILSDETADEVIENTFYNVDYGSGLVGEVAVAINEYVYEHILARLQKTH